MSSKGFQIGPGAQKPPTSRNLFQKQPKTKYGRLDKTSSNCHIRLIAEEKEKEKVQKEYRKLEDTNWKLRSRVKNLESNSGSLQKINDLENEVLKWTEELINQKKRYDTLKNSEERLKAENNRLKADKFELETQNRHVTAEIGKLKSEKIKIETISGEAINKLKNELETMKNSMLHSLESSIEERFGVFEHHLLTCKIKSEELARKLHVERNNSEKEIIRLNQKFSSLQEEARGSNTSRDQQLQDMLVKHKQEKSQWDLQRDKVVDAMTVFKKTVLTTTDDIEKSAISRIDSYSFKVQVAVSSLQHAIKILQRRLSEDEEESFRFTNDFTSAGDGSVLDISKRYRHLQHNTRASAVRASKKLYKTQAKVFFCKQAMNAFNAAKKVLLEKSSDCVCKHLITLLEHEEKCDSKLLKACKRVVDNSVTNEATDCAIGRILEELKSKDVEERTEATKDSILPQEVNDYYDTLAKLTWQAISRPIPMVFAMEEQVYRKDLHDLKDGESDDEGKEVVYVYPVLYTSNQWPRQVAQIGRVELADVE